MKMLLFSDLHCDREAAWRLVEASADAEVLVGAGDFGSLRQNVRDTIEVLAEVDKPAILVPGNNESREELEEACAGWPTAHVLHGESATVDGVCFFGLGGGVPVTPFGSWSWDFSEADATALLKACPPRAVLVSHSPPHGVVDVTSRGQHLGSRAVRLCIEQTQPQVVVCGHIHESGGKIGYLGEVPVINAGPSGMLHAL